MYVSVQQASHRLGVSIPTIRRWTSSGFLPCTRTPGGHRRIASEDIDELLQHIGGHNHRAAREARERELQLLVEAGIAVAGQLDLNELLVEIAERVTGLLDCRSCQLSEYKPAENRLEVLAEYTREGRPRLSETGYDLNEYTLTRKVLEEQVVALVNTDDPRADPVELALLRRDGDMSCLFVPLVFRGETIGLLAVLESTRTRSYSPQELRMCRALAGHAAVALHNAALFREKDSTNAQMQRARDNLQRMALGMSGVSATGDLDTLLLSLADAVCSAFRGVSCVVSAGSRGVGSSGTLKGLDVDTPRDSHGAPAYLLTAIEEAHGEPVVVRLTLSEPGTEGMAECLDLAAAIVSLLVHASPCGRSDSS